VCEGGESGIRTPIFRTPARLNVVRAGESEILSISAPEGSMSSTIVYLRMILGAGLKTGSHSFILSHNHPSGNLTPSNQDIELTKKIRKAAAFMDLILLDHLIVDSNFNFYSFAECDLL